METQRERLRNRETDEREREERGREGETEITCILSTAPSSYQL